MICLTEDQWLDLLDRGGLEAAAGEEQEHLGSCRICCERWGEIAAAAALLERLAATLLRERP